MQGGLPSFMAWRSLTMSPLSSRLCKMHPLLLPAFLQVSKSLCGAYKRSRVLKCNIVLCIQKLTSRNQGSQSWFSRVISVFFIFPSCRRVGESDCSDGEEDFYYTEIRLNTDSVADGLSSLSPVSPSLASPPSFPTRDVSRPETSCAKTETKVMTPLSRSAPTNLYLVHTDHAYQVKWWQWSHLCPNLTNRVSLDKVG